MSDVSRDKKVMREAQHLQYNNYSYLLAAIASGMSVPLKLNKHGWTVKGALYRIWCGVNRLGDSGVKVV